MISKWHASSRLSCSFHTPNVRSLVFCFNTSNSLPIRHMCVYITNKRLWLVRSEFSSLKRTRVGKTTQDTTCPVRMICVRSASNPAADTNKKWAEREKKKKREREISVIVDTDTECFSSAKRHTSQTREKDVGIMSVFMYDSINQRCVQLAGRSVETLFSCRAKRELTGRTMGFCEPCSLFFSFHSFSCFFFPVVPRSSSHISPSSPRLASCLLIF